MPMAAKSKLKIVCLEEQHCAIPPLEFPHEYVGYHKTQTNEVLERVRNANIIITTIMPIIPEVAEQCSRLQLIAITATGSGWVNRAYFESKGIFVINCPGSNIPAVSEHSLGLYFAVRRQTINLHELTVGTDEWEHEGTMTQHWQQGPPLSISQETLGIIGYGALGKRIEWLFKSIGIADVLIAERKGTHQIRPGRTTLRDVLEKSSTIMVCCPKDVETINLIGEKELGVMRKDAILINMARGGIVNEEALAKALRNRWIYGAATDVVDEEPGRRGHCPLLPLDANDRVPYLTISPHISWFAQKTVSALQNLIKTGIESWVAGEPINVLVKGREPR